MAPTRLLALALTALTGFSGLVYEVTWEKYLAVLLGSHSEATAAVLGIFLGGLSLGYSVFGRVTQVWVARGRSHRLLVLYGVVEASIGV
jgi:predicted membrane-bound spermidine synthase